MAKLQFRATKKFLIPYLAVLIIPTIFTSVAYFRTVALVEEDAIEINQSLLEKSVYTLDRRFDEIDNMVEQISQNARIQRFHFVGAPFSVDGIIDILDTRSYLYNFNLSNDLVHAYYIHFRSNKTVMAPPDITYKATMFYGDGEVEYVGVSYDEWQDSVFNEHHSRELIPARRVLKEGNTRKRIGTLPVVRYLNSLGSSEHFIRGTVEFLLDVGAITRFLDGLQIAGTGIAFIRDANGTIITRIGGDDATDLLELELPEEVGKGVMETTIGGSRMIVTYAKSENTGWVLVAAQPLKNVMQKVVYVRNLLFLLVGLSLIIGLGIAIVMARREGVPFTRLVDSISDYIGLNIQTGFPGYEELGTSISRVIDDNKELNEVLNEQKPLLRTSFFTRLLNGGFNSREEAESFMSHIDVDLSSGWTTVAILHLAGETMAADPESDMLALDLRRILLTGYVEKVRQNTYVQLVDQHRVALVINSGQVTRDVYDADTRSLLPQIARDLFRQTGMSVAIGVGRRVENLLDLSHSYEEASQAINSRLHHARDPVTWYVDLPEGKSAFYFPAVMENRLQNAVKSGDEELTVSLLDEIYRENATGRNLSLNSHRLFLSELVGCFVRLLEQMRVGDHLPAAELLAERSFYQADLEAVYRDIGKLYRDLVRTIELRKKSHNLDLVDSIKAYIDENYHNPQICLSLLSSEFSLSEVYISTLFKEQTGENLYRHLELTRLNHARSLLQSSNMSVKVVAERVGYSSNGTFGRAFKRTFGMRPSDFRVISDKTK